MHRFAVVVVVVIVIAFSFPSTNFCEVENFQMLDIVCLCLCAFSFVCCRHQTNCMRVYQKAGLLLPLPLCHMRKCNCCRSWKVFFCKLCNCVRRVELNEWKMTVRYAEVVSTRKPGEMVWDCCQKFHNKCLSTKFKDLQWDSYVILSFVYFRCRWKSFGRWWRIVNSIAHKSDQTKERNKNRRRLYKHFIKVHKLNIRCAQNNMAKTCWLSINCGIYFILIKKKAREKSTYLWIVWLEVVKHQKHPANWQEQQ